MTSTELDEDVSGMHLSLQEFYKDYAADTEPGAAGLDGDLRAIFDDLADAEVQGTAHETGPRGGADSSPRAAAHG